MKQIAVVWLMGDIPPDPDAFAAVLHRFGFDGASFKVLHNSTAYNQPAGPKPLRAFFDRLRELDYIVEAWGFHVEDQTHRQGEAIEESRQKLGFSTYHADLEGEWLQPYGMPKAFKALCDPLKVGGFELLVNSYRMPEKQPNFPWSAAANHEKVDGFSPQMYWALAHNPAQQVTESIRQYRKFTDKPLYMMGPLFGESFLNPSTGKSEYWEPTIEELVIFRETCQAAGMAKIYWYRIGWALKRGRFEMIAAATGIDRGTVEPPIPPEPEPGALLVVDNCQFLNIRSEANPFDDDNRLASIGAGQHVQDLGISSGNWKYVRVVAFEGWMHGAHLSPDES